MSDAKSPRDVMLECMFERNRSKFHSALDGAVKLACRQEAEAVLAALLAAGFVVVKADAAPADQRAGLKLVEGNPHARGFKA